MTNKNQHVPTGHRAGYVAIVGQPNVGKSTLINAFLDYKLAIVTSKPQTTRNRIVGIRTDKSSQVIFVDTPGVHQSDKELNRAMMAVVKRSIADVDLVLYLVDSQDEQWTEREKFTLKLVQSAKVPTFLIPNKIDRIDKRQLLPLMERYTNMGDFREIIPISALKQEGLETLLDAIVGHMPEGPRYFPPDQLSELQERDIAAEMVREQIFVLTRQEIPYSSAVLVEKFEELPKRKLIRIHATIHVEKSSQKGILIGKGGQMLRQIGEGARKEMERLFGTKVYLELFIRIEKNWTQDPRALRRLGLLEK